MSCRSPSFRLPSGTQSGNTYKKHFCRKEATHFGPHFYGTSLGRRSQARSEELMTWTNKAGSCASMDHCSRVAFHVEPRKPQRPCGRDKLGQEGSTLMLLVERTAHVVRLSEKGHLLADHSGSKAYCTKSPSPKQQANFHGPLSDYKASSYHGADYLMNRAPHGRGRALGLAPRSYYLLVESPQTGVV